MRIKEVNIDQIDGVNDGLKEIILKKLDKIVIIAGKNGAGKTRLLNKVRYCASRARPHKYFLEQQEILNLKYQSNIPRMGMPIIQDIQESDFLKELQSELDIASKFSQNIIFENQDLNVKPQILNFKPIETILTDYKGLTLGQIEENYLRIMNSLGSNFTKDCTIPYIQILQNKFFNVTHPEMIDVNDDTFKENIKNFYPLLKTNIHNLLQMPLGRLVTGEPTLNNFEIGKSNLSNGQKILLQLAVLLTAQGHRLSDTILIIDEPESYLHPNSLFQFFDNVINSIKDGQIWIATHSISLISHFATDYPIYYMEDGKVELMGKIQERVITSLLGNDEQKIKLINFLQSPFEFAVTRYCYECLFDPKTVMTGPQDKQSVQISSVIEGLYKKNQKFRLLDFGAGKGRLLSTFIESDFIDYIAYDIFDKDKTECLIMIEKFYGNSIDKYFNDSSQLFSKYNDNSFDIIILCNVFHEIPLKAWQTMFSQTEIINKLLKKDGYLLVVEDQVIPVGESAHEHGFIVFDELEFKELFLTPRQNKDLSLIGLS